MTDIKKTVLITGSTRGLGLAFATHYSKAGWNVIGTARANSSTDKLAALSPFKIVTMDTGNEDSVVEAGRKLDGVAIDLLINNAGIGEAGGLESATKESLMRQFEVNAVGPFLVTRALLPNLQLAAKTHGSAFVVQLSSFMGSITSNTDATVAYFGEQYGYSASKAALNMITRTLAVKLRPSDIVAVSFHPGYVDTDMTEGAPIKATLQPSDSVAAMADRIAQLSAVDAGKFFNLDAQIPMLELPW
ncbi:hypothetical protein BBO99_00009887 [Phytophthora kernoviae]|uniref:Short-chain dehydrogenase n=2 Tax=Phytophthora kernoviae TaxID=325452 RepID=A0A3R7JN20_9STRA|nr:hypothetical protein G195_011369 [Phytophthora kernoviae 00238/432]KAG2502486.1 hypothetical protein JM18_009895 [Phytophthora kernoviae]KAG2502565.1 hypothetical protein JM16_009353 [Phytophthora kernoviae]RLN02967.1 hypothetical protein BBI17_009942 [Phytophthora kernoviae]RLN72175.1 hypothetical protein BBO99_00009887 [Phytophthora kernoviae]